MPLVLRAQTSPTLGAESSYDVFDLSGTYAMSERTTLRFGLDNLFDKAPVCTGGRSATSYPAPDPHPSPGGGETEAGFYDVLGRRIYVGANVSF